VSLWWLTKVFYYQFLFFLIMQTGTVKFFNESKGFGFIVDDETAQEIFVHVTGLGGTQIRQDDKVSFETIEGKQGLNAVNVKKIR
jgi:CspA family cold shock protein